MTLERRYVRVSALLACLIYFGLGTVSPALYPAAHLALHAAGIEEHPDCEKCQTRHELVFEEVCDGSYSSPDHHHHNPLPLHASGTRSIYNAGQMPVASGPVPCHITAVVDWHIFAENGPSTVRRHLLLSSTPRAPPAHL